MSHAKQNSDLLKDIGLLYDIPKLPIPIHASTWLPTILLVLLTLQGQIMRPFYGEQIVPCNKSHCPPILEYTRLEFLRHHEDRMASDQIYIPFLFTKDLDGVEPSFPAICLLECSFQFRAEDQPFIHLLSSKLKNIQLKAISDSSTAPRFSNPIEFEWQTHFE